MGAQSYSPAEPNFDSEADEDESPVHRVHLDPFRLARYPVTVGQYQRFVEDEGYNQEQWWQAGGFGEFTEPEDWSDQVQYPARPVVGVSWFEAAAFCQWSGLRLPMEAEWERAARGKGGRRFPWGNEDANPSRLNYGESGIDHPTPVGIYPLGSTPEGVYDLAGNNWEWCEDWFSPYSEVALINPLAPKEASLRVIRGGSWFSYARGCRGTYRDRREPEFRLNNLGFRVVLGSPSQKTSSGRQERA
jgi:formylglycine-generating enzyme required for sulfatase activity